MLVLFHRDGKFSCKDASSYHYSLWCGGAASQRAYNRRVAVGIGDRGTDTNSGCLALMTRQGCSCRMLMVLPFRATISLVTSARTHRRLYQSGNANNGNHFNRSLYSARLQPGPPNVWLSVVKLEDFFCGGMQLTLKRKLAKLSIIVAFLLISKIFWFILSLWECHFRGQG